MKNLSIVLASLCIYTGIAAADTGSPVAISTQEFVGVCSDQMTPESQVYCDVYGQGVYDSYLVTRHPRVAPEFICVVQPAQSRREVMNQFADWTKANPQYSTAPAADTLLRYLAVKFPCYASAMPPANPANKIIR